MSAVSDGLSTRSGDGIDLGLEEVAGLLRACRSALVLTHRNPDGDAIGAATALVAGLRVLDKEATVVCPDTLPAYLLAIPGAGEIAHHMNEHGVDLVVTVDVSDPALLYPLPASAVGYLATRHSLNIDHHFSNLHYARYNHVNSDAASATEIVYALLQALGIPIDTATATELLYGIVNDTHSFQNSNTTPQTLRLSADLVEAGADLSAIIFDLLIARRASSARLWARVLPTLTFADQERVAFLTVSLDALSDTGATMTDADGMVEFLRSIQGVDLAVLFKQTGPEAYRLSMRTSERVDATIVAGAFGGGGHRRAAGCDTHGALEGVQGRVVHAYHAARQVETS